MNVDKKTRLTLLVNRAGVSEYVDERWKLTYKFSDNICSNLFLRFLPPSTKKLACCHGLLYDYHHFSMALYGMLYLAKALGI